MKNSIETDVGNIRFNFFIFAFWYILHEISNFVSINNSKYIEISIFSCIYIKFYYHKPRLLAEFHLNVSWAVKMLFLSATVARNF